MLMRLPRQVTALTCRPFVHSRPSSQEMPLDEAQRFFQKILKSSPRDIRGLTGLGAVYVKQGNFHSAVPLLEDAVSFDPEYAEAQYFLGER